MKMHNLNPKDFAMDEILSIELIGDKETVDITVDDTHMFYANDVYSHNSSVDLDFIGIESISESFNKVMIADVIISLTRRIDQRLENQGTMFIAKNRAGRDGMLFPVEMDTSIVKIEVDNMNVDATKDILSGTYKKDTKMNNKQKEDHLTKIDSFFNS
jgi:hypothetical protein